MKNKKALVSPKTKGFDKSFDKVKYKPFNHLRQQKQLNLEFNEPQPKQPKSLGIILCFDCQRQAELDGFRFALVPLCECCRTNRSLENLNNQIERRKKQ